MNKAEREVLTRLYVSLRRISDQYPRNPYDIERVAKCARDAKEAADFMAIAVCELSSKCLDNANDALDISDEVLFPDKPEGSK